MPNVGRSQDTKCAPLQDSRSGILGVGITILHAEGLNDGLEASHFIVFVQTSPCNSRPLSARYGMAIGSRTHPIAPVVVDSTCLHVHDGLQFSSSIELDIFENTGSERSELFLGCLE